MNTNAADSRPTILSPQHVTRAIGDPNFFTLMPEFLPVRKKLDVMNAAPGPGCPSCARRRAAQALSSDFASILVSLSSDGMQRLKKYYGVSSLVVRALNPATGRVELKEV